MPTCFFPWRMLRVSFKDHWRGGFLKGCSLVLVEFNVISMYKTKLFYVSADWHGSSFLRGLRKKGQYNYPMSKFWFTFFFFVGVGGGGSCNFLWIWNLSWNHNWESFCSLLFHYSLSEFHCFPALALGFQVACWKSGEHKLKWVLTASAFLHDIVLNGKPCHAAQVHCY